MPGITEEEWKAVQEALVVGGLRECIDEIIESRFPSPFISTENRWIIEQAYDDGDGNTIALIPTGEGRWFKGVYDGDHELMLGLEDEGTLYCIVLASGGGQVAVIVDGGLLDNEAGIAFPNVALAKAYVVGLTAK